MDKLPEKLFLFWSRSAGRYSKLRAALSQDGWTVAIVQHAASLSHLSHTDSSNSRIYCLAILDPKENFTQEELHEIQNFVARGNSALVAASANQEDECQLGTNINDLVRLYGFEFTEDCVVVRPNPYKLYHPKEAMLEEFVANRSLGEVLRRHMERAPSEDCLSRPQQQQGLLLPVKFGPRVIYAHGCTLRRLDDSLARVDKQQETATRNNNNNNNNTIVATSSRWALPGGQPICALHRAGRAGVALLGSARMLSDQYLHREDNRAFASCLMDFLASPSSFPINVSDARTLEIAASNMTPDLGLLAREPIGRLKRLEPLPANKAALINTQLFGLDHTKLPLVMEAHRELGLEYAPLRLMAPARLNWSPAGGLEPARFLLKKSGGRERSNDQ